MAEYDFGPMYRSYSGMWMNDAPDNFVELSEEQKRKKAAEETFRNLPWYMKYDKQISEGILGTEDSPTAAGYLKKAIDVPLESISKGRDELTSAIAGVPEQPFTKTIEGALSNLDLGSAVPGVGEGGGLPLDMELEAPEAVTRVASKGIAAMSDPAQLAFMAGGPAGSIAGAALAPGMISAGGEEIGKGISGVESGNMGTGVGDIASGLFDVGMGGLGIKHPIEAAAKPLAGSVLDAPLELGTPSGERGAVGDISKLNTFEDSQFRKYGKEWRGLQSPEEASYHKQLMSGAAPAPPALENFAASLDDPALAPRIESLVKEGYDPARAVRIAKAEVSEIPEEHLTPEDVSEYMSREKAKEAPMEAEPLASVNDPTGIADIVGNPTTPTLKDLYNSVSERERAHVDAMSVGELQEELQGGLAENDPIAKGYLDYVAKTLKAKQGNVIDVEAIPEVEPLIGTEEPMAAEPLRRGRPKKETPPVEDAEVYDIEKESEPSQKPENYRIKLSNGEIYNTKAISPEEALSKINQRLEEYGSEVTAEEATRVPSKLERLVGDVSPSREREMLKASQAIEKGKTAEEIRAIKTKASEQAKQARLEAKKAERLTQKSEIAPSERNLLDDITDLPKTLRAGFDVSFPMRQGLFLLNRREGLAGVGRGFKSFIEREHTNVQKDLAARPNADLYKEFGLQQVEYDPATLEAKSEQFPATAMAEKIPGLKQSERIYIDQGNLMRANVFDKLSEKWRAQGKTPENRPDLYRKTAEYLNVLTGRDTLGKRFAKAGNILNKVFFSPRFIKSRAQLLNPVFYARLPRELQMEAIRDVGGTLGTLGVLLGGAVAAARQAGYTDKDIDIGADPRATNFGKLKVGHVSYDFFSSLLPLIRTSARLATGTKVTPSGEYQLGGLSGRSALGVESNLPKAPFGASTGSELMTLGEGKLAPVPTVAKGLMSGQGFAGEEYGMGEAARDLLVPMSIADFATALNDYDVGTATATLPSLLGIGVQTDIPPSKIGKKKGRKGKGGGGAPLEGKSSSKKSEFGF